MFSRLAILCVCLLAACTNSNDLGRGPVPLGDFALGYNVVVAPKMVKGPVSREASEEEWKAALTTAIDDRFRRYDEVGSKLYHLGISVEGYVLAEAGIPLVFSPKSVLIVNVTLWDDAAQKKLNDAPYQLTVLESASGETLMGSGLTQSKEVQMGNLSRNAAKEIQNWMQKQMREQKWFGGPAPKSSKAKPAEETAAAKTPDTATVANPDEAPIAANSQTAPAPNVTPSKKRPLPKPGATATLSSGVLLPDETILEPEVVLHAPAAPVSE
jgi:hypothetical protein